MTSNSLPDTGNVLVKHIQQVCDCIDSATHKLHNLHCELNVKAILLRQGGFTSLDCSSYRDGLGCRLPPFQWQERHSHARNNIWALGLLNFESKFHCNTGYPVMHGVFVLLLYLSHSDAVFSSRFFQDFKIFNPARNEF